MPRDAAPLLLGDWEGRENIAAAPRCIPVRNAQAPPINATRTKSTRRATPRPRPHGHHPQFARFSRPETKRRPILTMDALYRLS